MTNEVVLWEHFLHLFSKYCWSYNCAHALGIASEEFTKNQELDTLTQMWDLIIVNTYYVPDMLITVSKVFNFIKILWDVQLLSLKSCTSRLVV